MLRILFLVPLLIFSALLAADEMYKIVHPDGTVEFTDDPNKPGAQPITVPKLPTYKPQPVPKPAKPAKKAEPKKEAGKYTRLTITSPSAEQTLFFDAVGMPVTVSIEPALAKGHQIVITLNGNVAARGAQTSFVIQGVYRGTHTISAKVVDQNGMALKSAESVNFYMRQHSRLR